MPYVRNTGHQRLKLPSDPEYWVEMKDQAREGDAEAAQAAMMEVTVDLVEAARSVADGNGNGVASMKPSKVEMGAYNKTLALRLITAWNLTDERDEPLPIDLEGWDWIDPEDAKFLKEEAQKRLRRRPPAEQRPFENPSSQLLRVTELPTGKRTRR
jgi:hypothetical protein